MNGRITDDPVVTAMLKHLADRRGPDDPLGELSRELLKGDTAPADLLRIGWYGEGLADAASAGQADLARLSPDQREKLEDAAARLGKDQDTTGRDQT